MYRATMRLILLAAIVAAAAVAASSLWNRSPVARSGGAALAQTRSDSALRPRHPVIIHHPSGPPRIATNQLDALGHPVTLSCASCHGNRASNLATSKGQDLKEFHQSLNFAHGSLKCVSCHQPSDYNSLRLADGESLAFSDVQSLCAQCHTPQARDYEHGAHGGMNGHWDLTRGARQRKGCIDCHDPHAPAFPNMVPAFKSLDRFLDPSGASHE
jgi:formate-dependent nitrite reductase cytochrome c552 subunit